MTRKLSSLKRTAKERHMTLVLRQKQVLASVPREGFSPWCLQVCAEPNPIVSPDWFLVAQVEAAPNYKQTAHW